MSGASTASSKLNDLGLSEDYDFNDVWEVTPRQVNAWREAGEDLVLIDSRTPQENRLVCIDGAMLVPWRDLDTMMPQLKALADKKLVIHCHHGGPSLKMATVLRAAGFRDVKSTAGGIDLWALDIEEGMARY